MRSPKSKILFVGDGDWSAKVSKLILNQDPSTSVEIIGARDFLTGRVGSPSYVNALHSTDFIWVATNPGMQLNVLKKLKNINAKIILEKPLARSYPELMEIKEAISNSTSEIFLSQPWTYSDLWKRYITLLVEKNSVNRIVIFRGGDNFRSDFNSILDWIPHDLYLIASLAEEFKVTASQVEIEVLSKTSKNISVNFKLGNIYSVEVNSGYHLSRIAQIFGYSDLDLKITGDFLGGEVKFLNINEETLEILPTESSILNMIEHYRRDSPNLNWDLILKLYSGILN